jgi:hypothetical protein
MSLRLSSDRRRRVGVNVDRPSGDPHAAGSIRAESEHLAHVATVVLNEHVNEWGLCAMCGGAFPCELAVLAEHSVTLL